MKTKSLCKYYGNGENEVKALQDVNIENRAEEIICCSCRKIRFRKVLLHMLAA